MGKKKKFIDKKNAQHFTLVHRSQRDPLKADEESSQHVLIPTGVSASSQSNLDPKEENEKYGIYFDDDYDYMQHLKERGSGILVLSNPLDQNQQKETRKFGNISLPAEALPSGYEEDIGMLNLGVLPRGPQPDWDPDIVAALDDGVDFNDPENFLDDDFIKMANSDNSKTAFEHDFYTNEQKEKNFENCDNELFSDLDSDDLYSDKFSYESDDDDDDDTKSRFTNYSMTSSVIRRTEGLKNLDHHFEKIMEEYDEDEIGAIDHQELSGGFNTKSELVENIINEYINTQKPSTLPDLEGDSDENALSHHQSENTDDENIFSQFEKLPKREHDCESYVTTHSNLYNHPKLLDVKGKQKKIILHKKTGVPIDVFNKITAQNVENVVDKLPEKLNNVRIKNETSEEKKKRKQEVKIERRNRRMEKKTNKIAFKNELQKQDKSYLNTACQKGVKI